MPKRRVNSAAQKAASVRNLAIARAARKRTGTPKNRKQASVGSLRQQMILKHPKTGELHYATKSFRGVTFFGKRVK